MRIGIVATMAGLINAIGQIRGQRCNQPGPGYLRQQGGSSIAANNVAGVQAARIEDEFPARKGGGG